MLESRYYCPVQAVGSQLNNFEKIATIEIL